MTPWTIHEGDALAMLRTLPESSVQCCVTSPPYWGLRDYGTASWEGGDVACDHVADPGVTSLNTTSTLGYAPGGKVRGEPRRIGSENTTAERTRRQFRSECGKCGAVRIDSQIGLEPTPDEYVGQLVEVFREVRRVLRDDGTLWLNLGDSYAGSWGAQGRTGQTADRSVISARQIAAHPQRLSRTGSIPEGSGLKPKDLVGVPWMVAKALQSPFYTGRIARESDRGWLAGFLDGEGTISYVERDRGVDHTPTHDVRVFVTNCDDAPLRHFAAMTAGHVYRHDGERENRFGSRPCFRWQMGTHDGALLLRELYPYLRTKRAQAALVWTLYTTLRHKNGHARTPADVVEKRRAIATLVRALNAGESVDVPDWVEEPPGCYEPGWYLRSDVIWAKPNPMPESITDRPTKAHEYVFLLAKSERYYFDAEAVREPDVGSDHPRRVLDDQPSLEPSGGMRSQHRGIRTSDGRNGRGRNIRTVWNIAAEPFPGAHFATFPTKLVEPCILAGAPRGGVVLDPFSGAGTTGLVANRLGRAFIGIELNPAYAAMARERITNDAPLVHAITPSAPAATEQLVLVGDR